ncbi:ABC transporter [Streptomyces sp. P3]|nr:ABC transporter [Streptomyces sp. P3]
MSTSPGLSRAYAGKPFDEVMEGTRAALAQCGFGVLTEIDMQATLREKLGVAWERYVILGACNPPLAHRALEATRQIGLLLPCNVVVRQDAADPSVTVVEAVDPAVMAEVTDATGVAAVAQEAAERLEAALALLDEELGCGTGEF